MGIRKSPPIRKWLKEKRHPIGFHLLKAKREEGEAEMEHISLSQLILLGGEPIIRDPEEARHLSHCQHCRKLLLWFGDEPIIKFEGCKETPQESAGQEELALTNAL
jgi:hypothetical protein